MKRLLIFLLVLCFGSLENLAQTKSPTVGNIIIKVSSDIVLQVPINSKIPLVSGEKYRVETSNVSSMFQIDTFSVSRKVNEATVTFKVVNQINSSKFRYFTKKFVLKIGEKKKFNFSVKLAFEPRRNYSVIAFYESKEANNEQSITDN